MVLEMEHDMKCRTCKAHCKWAGEEESDHGKCLVGYVPVTNEDRVKSMSAKELAELFKSPLFFDKPWCTLHESPCRHLNDDGFHCAECLVDWLEKEAE